MSPTPLKRNYRALVTGLLDWKTEWNINNPVQYKVFCFDIRRYLGTEAHEKHTMSLPSQRPCIRVLVSNLLHQKVLWAIDFSSS